MLLLRRGVREILLRDATENPFDLGPERGIKLRGFHRFGRVELRQFFEKRREVMSKRGERFGRRMSNGVIQGSKMVQSGGSG